MNPRLHFAASGLALALAASTTASAQNAAMGNAGVPAPQISIAPAANDAVQVVNGFMAALAAGKLAVAGKFLDPGVVVIADGVVHGGRDDYLGSQARTDAAMLHDSQRRLLRRQARAGANFAWVISEKALSSNDAGKSSGQSSTETMLLAKTLEGWKIVHIHWSSRATGKR